MPVLDRVPLALQQDDAPRVVLVVEHEVAARRVEAEERAVVERAVPAGLDDRGGGRAGVPGGPGRREGLGPGDGVVAGGAVQEVVAEPAEDDVVGEERPEQRVVEAAVEGERRDVDALGEQTRPGRGSPPGGDRAS